MKKMNDNFVRDVLSSMMREAEDKFSEESSIYIAPTSNVKDMCDLFHNYGSVLTVGGSGGISFESLLRGAQKVDCFDINKRQRAFYDLLCSSIRFLDYEEFCEFFSRDGKMFMSPILLDRVGHFLLDEDNYYILEPLFYFSRNKNFRFDYETSMKFLTRFTSYYNKDEYCKLQKILQEKNVDFEVCDIFDVPNVFKDKKYDLIFLDNIFQYYKDIRMLDSAYKVNRFIKNNLANLLNDGGTIQVNYGFQLSTAALDSSKPFVAPYLRNEMISVEKKEGINGLLLSKGDYDIYFIPGVEAELANNVENVVLTYTKKCNI